MIKKILYGLLGLIVLLVIVGFFLPGKLEVSKSITVNAPPEYVFEEVNQLENWSNWSYWNTLDKDLKITYGDTRAGLGAFYSWDGENVGTGKIVISESTPYNKIKADLHFMEGDTARAWYDFEPEGAGTKLTMGFSSDFGMNPFKRWMGPLFLKNEMDRSFDYSLKKIKEIAEAKPRFTIPITQEDVAPFTYIGLNQTMNPKDMNAVSKQMEKMYTELFTALKKSKVEAAGSPFCIYPNYTPESMEMICAIPVAEGAKLPAKYKVMTGPGGNAIKGVHNGDYKNLGVAHDELNNYIKFKKLEINGAPWEVYITDPTVEKDTSKWITEIYYPVKESQSL
jgi:effector-binding domain-containing protein